MRRHPFGLLSGIVALFAANLTLAQEAGPSEQELAAAREDFAIGVDYADAGDWERALGEFRKVVEVMPAPPVRFNLASALAELGQYPEAELWFEGLVHDEAATPEVREASAARLAQMRSEGARLSFATDTAEAVLVDGFAVGPEAFERGVLVRPGTRLVEAYRDGQIVARRRVVMTAGRDLRVTFPESGEPSEDAYSPAPVDLTVPRETTHDRPDRSKAKWIAVGVAAAVVLVGIGVGAGVAAGSSGPYEGNFVPGRLTW